MANTKTGYRATSKWLIASPFKVRPVADLVRAKLIRKVVSSAAANALNKNRKLGEDMLYIKELRIDEGPRLKRIWFRARGRADMQLRRMCHISCIVDEIGKKTEA